MVFFRLDTWESDQPTWLETLKILHHHKDMLDSLYNSNPLPDTPSKKRKIDPEYSTGTILNVFNNESAEIGFWNVEHWYRWAKQYFTIMVHVISLSFLDILSLN